MAPTIEDARLLAREVAEDDERVARVLVFGSVARSAADSHSDLDLVVLLDLTDVSPQERVDAKTQVDRAVRRRSRWPCDVVVRTTPQWEHLTRNVSASFAAGISGEAVEVFARSGLSIPSGAGCSIEEVAHDNIAIASNRLAEAARELSNMRRLVHDIHEEEAEITRSGEDGDDTRVTRYRWFLSAGHLTIELAVKAMIAAEGTSPARTHALDTLIEALKDQTTVRRLAASVAEIREPGGQIRNWRLGVYEVGEDDENGDGWQAALTSASAAAYIHAAVETVAQAANVLEAATSSPRHHARVTRARQAADRLAGYGITAETIEHGIDPATPQRSPASGRASRQSRAVEAPQMVSKMRRRLLKDSIRAELARNPAAAAAEVAETTGASRPYVRRIKRRLSG